MTSEGDPGRCTFCRIINGTAEAPIVFEDEGPLAFLDNRPLFPGHCLLVPKEHHETIRDLPEQLVGHLFLNAQRLSGAVESGLGAEGTFIAINNKISQSVPHLHIHIVPRRRGDGLRGFFWPRQGYRDQDHIREIQEAIRGAVGGST